MLRSALMRGLCAGDRRPGGGPGPAGRRMAGLVLARGVRCAPSYRRETIVLSTFGSSGAEVAAGDLREIADVEPGAGNNRAVGTAAASSFPNGDAPLGVPAGGVVNARGMGCRCRRAAARPSRGTARVFLREVL